MRANDQKASELPGYTGCPVTTPCRSSVNGSPLDVTEVDIVLRGISRRIVMRVCVYSGLRHLGRLRAFGIESAYRQIQIFISIYKKFDVNLIYVKYFRVFERETRLKVIGRSLPRLRTFVI